MSCSLTPLPRSVLSFTPLYLSSYPFLYCTLRLLCSSLFSTAALAISFRTISHVILFNETFFAADDDGGDDDGGDDDDDDDDDAYTISCYTSHYIINVLYFILLYYYIIYIYYCIL
jgi:hypothetical protein